MSHTSDQRGLLLAMMEPPPAMEEEFQDWYDTEHFPERAAVKGFLTAHRFVCIAGWPRYLALYDLQDVQVLHGPDYGAIAGKGYSPWTHRVVSRVWGQYRAEGVQLYPGQALFGARGAAARIVLYRFRRVPGDLSGPIKQGLRSLYEAQPETAQVRVYIAQQPDGTDYLGIVESRGAVADSAGGAAAFGPAGQYLDLVNVYVPYTRRMAGAFPKET
jgi:hypothetical protein